VSVKDKWVNSKGKLKTTLKYEMVSIMAHGFFPTLAETEGEVKVDSCRKRGREELTVLVHKLCREELSDVDRKGYDVVTELP
jgi:hypothetical protein